MGSLDRSPSPDFPFTVEEDLTPLPEYVAASTTTLDFSGLLPVPLKLHENRKTGCGGQLWPAGMVLAKHMLRYHGDKLEKARILELGAGGGLVGLAVAKACKLDRPLYITDQIEMEELMQRNIALNGLNDGVKGVILNWGEPLSQEIVDFRPDTILCAECVYFEPAFPLLMKTLVDLLTLCPDASVYFCFKKRRRADLQFVTKAKKLFHVTEIEDEDRPVFSREKLFLYTFTSKQSNNATKI